MAKVKSIDKIDLPGGLYSAIRNDWEITINAYGQKIVVKLDSGEKSDIHPCTVELVNGFVYIVKNE